MVKHVFIIMTLMLGLANANANASHPYRPFVKEGKVWKYTYFRMRPRSAVFPVEFHMKGDTVINNINYKQVLTVDTLRYGDNNQHYFGAVREQDMVVYILYNDSLAEELLYDFNLMLSPPPYVQVETSAVSLRLDDVEEVRSGPTVRNQIWVVPYVGNEAMTTCWCYIEGIGWGNQMHPFYAYCLDEFLGYWFVGCYEDGECIFTEPDFTADVRNCSDLDNDWEVTIADVNLLIDAMIGRAHCEKADVNGDGVIDIEDLNIVINVMLWRDAHF